MGTGPAPGTGRTGIPPVCLPSLVDEPHVHVAHEVSSYFLGGALPGLTDTILARSLRIQGFIQQRNEAVDSTVLG